MSQPTQIRSGFYTFFSIALVILTACQALSPSPTAAPTPEPEIGAGQPVSSSDILAACQPELQAKAMHPEEVPNWAALGLAACYDLQLDLLDEGALTGQATVHFRNLTGSPLDEIVFRLYPNARLIFGGSLTINEASRDGSALKPEVFLDDQTAVQLPLGPALAPNESAVFEFAFEGETTRDFGGLPGVYGIFNYNTEMELVSLANWYPILAVWRDGDWDAQPVSPLGDAVVSESALYIVTVSYPGGWQVIGTGTEVETTEADGRGRSTFVSGPARDFTVLASPSWVVREQRVDGTTVRHWGLAGGEGRWEEALQATADSLALFNDLFGRYAYRELDVVAAPMMNASGVEYPGMFIIRDELYQADPSTPFWLGVVAAHETAHQWWYALVGNDVLESPWQDEGLATFSQLLFQERYQTEWYDGTLEFYRQTVDSMDSWPGDTSLGQPSDAFADWDTYGPVVYTQGAIFFMDLKEEIGEAAFFAALQDYYTSHRYRMASPDDLLDAFERSCGCQLDAFYADFGVVP